ncbi:MAG: TlpA family protein disulfide reductase [bacterium]|nr:TlpA family protein disulfide reductase [bacterium]
MLRALSAVWVLLCLVPPAHPSTGLDLEPCRVDSKKKRDRCIQRAIGAMPLSDLVAVLEPRATDDPELTLAAVEVVRSRSKNEADASRVGLLDLEGRAHFAAGRYAESARAYAAAIQLDPGTVRLELIRPGHASRFVDLGRGNGRLERGLAAFERAGLEDDATAARRRLTALPPSGAVDGEYGTPLVGRRWFKPLPQIDVELLDGSTFSFAEHQGNVLILDFWATWCEPCVRELPRLQEIWEQERDNGLIVLAINSEEPDPLIHRFADELGLTMPIGHYTGEMKRPFLVNQLPTVVVADRGGHIRGRWDGYSTGQERDIVGFAQKLLGPDADPPPVEAGRILEGDGRLAVRWIRDTRTRVEGLTVVPAGSSTPARLMVSHTRWLVEHGARGETRDEWGSGGFAGELRVAPDATEDGYRLLGFRRGSTEFVERRMPDGDLERAEAPAPILDVLALPGGDALVATIGGLIVRTGGAWEELPNFGLTSALARADGAVHALTQVDSRAAVVRLSERLEATGSTVAGRDAWTVIPGSGVFAVAPADVVSAVAGRFFPGGQQVALATRDGQLIVVDTESAEVALRAAWPTVRHVVAGDLDGDGLDELIVADESRLAVLGRASSPE